MHNFPDICIPETQELQAQGIHIKPLVITSAHVTTNTYATFPSGKL